MPSNLPRLTVRLPQEIIYKISAIAEKEHRSTNAEIHYIIEKYIEEYEAQQGKEEHKHKLAESSVSKIS